jgi:hypothetical protein
MEAWDQVRAFALELPNTAEDFPWGEAVVKIEKRDADPPPWRRHLVHGPMFLWLGRRDADVPAVAVRLDRSYEQAVTIAGAERTTISGLGQWGWLTVRLERVPVDLVCDWVDESYRRRATKRLVAELDRRRKERTTTSGLAASPPRHRRGRRRPDGDRSSP